MSLFKKLKMRLMPPSSRSFHAAIAEQERLLDELNSRVTAKDIVIEELKGRIDTSNQIIGELQQDMKEVLHQNAALQVTLDRVGSELNRFCNSKYLQRGIGQYITASILHPKSFAGYKNKYQGRTVVVCGAGESLPYYETLAGAVHIGINRAFLLEKVNFDYLFCCDFRGISHIQKELKEYRGNNCVKFFAYQDRADSEIPESFAMECNASRFYTDINIGLAGNTVQNISNSQFAVDLLTSPLGNFWSSTFSALQFALFTHPSKIYLAGCDCKGGHFNNVGKTEREVQEDIQERRLWWGSGNDQINDGLLQQWKDLKNFAGVYYPDTEIISINPMGLKGLFKDEYTAGFLERYGNGIAPLPEKTI